MKWFALVLLFFVVSCTSTQGPDIVQNSTNETIEVAGPQILAGKASSFVEFDHAHYNQSVQDQKSVVLYFYSHWCEPCQKHQEALMEMFTTLGDREVVGYRVNFRDSDTDAHEEALAAQYNVTKQGTLLITRENSSQSYEESISAGSVREWVLRTK